MCHGCSEWLYLVSIAWCLETFRRRCATSAIPLKIEMLNAALQLHRNYLDHCRSIWILKQFLFWLFGYCIDYATINSHIQVDLYCIFLAYHIYHITYIMHVKPSSFFSELVGNHQDKWLGQRKCGTHAHFQCSISHSVATSAMATLRGWRLGKATLVFDDIYGVRIGKIRDGEHRLKLFLRDLSGNNTTWSSHQNLNCWFCKAFFRDPTGAVLACDQECWRPVRLNVPSCTDTSRWLKLSWLGRRC